MKNPNALALVAVIPLYAAGWFLWMAGQWSAVLPKIVDPARLSTMLLPPLVLSAVYLGWLAARRTRKAAQPRKRLVQFAIVTGITVVAGAGEMLSGGRQHTLPASIGGALMVLVALLAFAVDRDAEMAMRILLLTLLIIVPAVVVGRVVAIGGGMVFYSLVRAIHGSAS